MTSIDEKILAVAKAIEGPYYQTPGGFTLQELRDIRWRRLNPQDIRRRILQAKSAMLQLDATGTEANGLVRDKGSVDGC